MLYFYGNIIQTNVHKTKTWQTTSLCKSADQWAIFNRKTKEGLITSLSISNLHAEWANKSVFVLKYFFSLFFFFVKRNQKWRIDIKESVGVEYQIEWHMYLTTYIFLWRMDLLYYVINFIFLWFVSSDL